MLDRYLICPALPTQVGGKSCRVGNLTVGKAGFPVGQTQVSVPFPISFPGVVSNIQLTFSDINFSAGTPSPTLAVVNGTVNGAGFGAYMSGAGGFNAYFFAIGS
ncbi:gp53-like domain-containing protein [Enterobacter asburiae]